MNADKGVVFKARSPLPPPLLLTFQDLFIILGNETISFVRFCIDGWLLHVGHHSADEDGDGVTNSLSSHESSWLGLGLRRVPTHLNSSPVLLSDINFIQDCLMLSRGAKFLTFSDTGSRVRSPSCPFNPPKRAIEISSYETNETRPDQASPVVHMVLTCSRPKKAQKREFIP
jgi:hypothetical protein